jgi:hypothetical protein
MKSSITILVILCIAVMAGSIVYLNRQKAPPVAESPPAQITTPTTPEKIVEAKPEPLPVVSEDVAGPAQIPAATSTAIETQSDDSTNFIHKTVDALLSAKNGPQKHELFQQLIKSGQIDQAIGELKQRALDNPNDAEIPTTLGEAQLNKVGAIHEAGGDINEQGILAMQADQSFNAALKIDPANFEAQLVKSISMTYWPAEPARDGQVVQTLSSLIDRQETMPSQPDFAQTYIYLGNEYQKIGQPDKAQATWQLGLTKFPNDPTLQKKISGP